MSRHAKKRWIPLIILAVVIIALIVILEVVRLNRRNLDVDVNRDGVSYVTYIDPNSGIKSLKYSEYQEIMDKTFDMLDGEYRYVSRWSGEGRDGGGPHCIKLYGDGDVLLDTIYYMDGYICVKRGSGTKYFLYEKEGVKLNMSEFEEIMDERGKYLNEEF